MSSLFGDKLPDVHKVANDKVSKVKGSGENKLNDAKGFGEGTLNDVKGFGSNLSSPADAGVFGGGKTSVASEVGDSSTSSGSTGGSTSPLSSGNKGSTLTPAGAAQVRSSPKGGSDKQGASSAKADAASGTPEGGAAGGGADKKNSQTEPKTYIVKPGEDLGIIAKKFRLPSWKYLYQLNKDKIGDNPDLLKDGTELTIPQWDTTSGDELIREKKADPFAYTGGLQYRYPWEAVSITLTDGNNNEIGDFEEELDLKVRTRKKGETILETKIKEHDIFEKLLPGGLDHVQIGVKGFPLIINEDTHYHPDDDPETTASEHTGKK